MTSPGATVGWEAQIGLEEVENDDIRYVLKQENVDEAPTAGDETDGADEVDNVGADDSEDPLTRALDQVGLWTRAVVAAHEEGIKTLDEASHNFLRHADAFTKLVRPYLKPAFFHDVQTNEDLAQVDPDDVVYLGDCRDAGAAYIEYLDLPNVRPTGCLLLPPGRRGRYNGITIDPPGRASQHKRGHIHHPRRLHYRGTAIAEDINIVVALGVPNSSQLLAHFWSCYGSDGDFAKEWSEGEFLVAFLSSFEPVHCASQGTYCGDEDYVAFMEGFTGVAQAEDIIGLNSKPCFDSFLPQYQGMQRSKAAKAAQAMANSGAATTASATAASSAAAASSDAGGDMIVPMSEAAANLVERGRVRRFTAGGCRARLTLRAGFDTGELTLPYELLSEKTMLHLSKVDLAALELDKKARPAQIAADVHLERRPENSEPLLLMGTIDEARFFSMWQMVVVIAGRRLVLSWGRGARALLPCPPTISKLVNIFAKHLGRAPLAAVPRPDFVKADDLKLCPNPSAAVLDWKRPRREQVEMAMQGSLSRAVGEPLEGEKSNRLALIDGGSNGQVYLPPHETLKPHELRACFCATPDAVKWAYMPRNEPGMPKKWNDWVGTMPKVLRGLMSDVREVRGLEEAADPWARQPPSKWPKWYTAERCAAGTYPAVGKPRPFGIGLTPSTKLGRQLSEEDPAYFYVDLDHWEASWLDPERGTKIPIDIERKNKDKEGNAVDGPALRVMKLVKEHLPRTDEAGPSKRQRGGSEDEEDGAKKKGKKKARGSEDDDDEWKP